MTRESESAKHHFHASLSRATDKRKCIVQSKTHPYQATQRTQAINCFANQGKATRIFGSYVTKELLMQVKLSRDRVASRPKVGHVVVVTISLLVVTTFGCFLK